MQWEFVVAPVLAIPLLILAVALVSYLNIGGIVGALGEARKRKTAVKKEETEAAKDKTE